jgi:YD repeat-containing protein
MIPAANSNYRHARHPVLRELGLLCHVHPETSWTLSELNGEAGEIPRMRLTLFQSDDLVIETLEDEKESVRYVFDGAGNLVSIHQSSAGKSQILETLREQAIDAIQKKFFDFEPRPRATE